MFSNFKCLKLPDGKVQVDGICVITHKHVRMIVPMDGIIAYYEEGKFIQDAFPDLTPGQREFFQSGMSEEGWAKVFPPETEG